MAGKWSIAARLSNRTRFPNAPGWILGAAIDRQASSADAAAGARSADGCCRTGDQPAQRAGLDLDAAWRCTG
jgi:hypothetical protein